MTRPTVLIFLLALHGFACSSPDQGTDADTDVGTVDVGSAAEEVGVGDDGVEEEPDVAMVLECEANEWANIPSNVCESCPAATLTCDLLDFDRTFGSWDPATGVLFVPLAVDTFQPATAVLTGNHAWSGGGPVTAGESVRFETTEFVEGAARFEIDAGDIPEDMKIRVDEFSVEDVCGESVTLEVFWGLEKTEASELKGGSCTVR